MILPLPQRFVQSFAVGAALVALLAFVPGAEAQQAQHHTFGIPSMAKYEMQFPAWSLGAEPQTSVPTTVLNALSASGKPPKTIAVVTSKFPSVHFMSLGARDVAGKR